MRAVAVYEAKNHFLEMITAVEHGEEITITRRGAPVARLVAIGVQEQARNQQRQQVRNIMQQLRILGGSGELGFTVRQAIETGRD